MGGEGVRGANTNNVSRNLEELAGKEGEETTDNPNGANERPSREAQFTGNDTDTSREKYGDPNKGEKEKRATARSLREMSIKNFETTRNEYWPLSFLKVDPGSV